MAEATANADLARNIDRLRGRAVLVLDSDPDRLRARGNAMQTRGANVTTSGSASRARSLWKPGSHFLVLIELGGAGPQFEEFHQYAAKAHGAQAFGFYTSQPPYLTSAMPLPGSFNSLPVSPADIAHAASHAAKPKTNATPATGPNAANAPQVAPLHAGLIAEASQLIAAIRPLARPQREHRVSSSLSFSQAVKAAERLVNHSS
jgi:hypothetical protein